MTGKLGTSTLTIRLRVTLLTPNPSELRHLPSSA